MPQTEKFKNSERKALFGWLLTSVVLVMLMIGVGGTTRLTRSGLSITEWKPVTGIVPPLTAADWEKEFVLYKASPEFQQVNSHFEIEDYKRIFWWEYIHRVLGRVIFFVAAGGAFVFWRKRAISGRFALGLPALIMFQGLMGWIMVKSGLNHRPAVSHYLLAVHFFLALTTLIVLYRQIVVQFKKPLGVVLQPRHGLLLLALGGLFLTQVLYGCFTSGLKAGLYYNTYPLMGGKFVPETAFDYAPWLANFVENPVLVQWVHRWLGTLTLVMTLWAGHFFVRRVSPLLLRPFLHLAGVVLAQFLLGVATLVFMVPVSTAVAHQMMAVLVVLGYFNLVFRVEWWRSRFL